MLKDLRVVTLDGDGDVEDDEDSELVGPPPIPCFLIPGIRSPTFPVLFSSPGASATLSVPDVGLA